MRKIKVFAAAILAFLAINQVGITVKNHKPFSQKPQAVVDTSVSAPVPTVPVPDLAPKADSPLFKPNAVVSEATNQSVSVVPNPTVPPPAPAPTPIATQTPVAEPPAEPVSVPVPPAKIDSGVSKLPEAAKLPAVNAAKKVVVAKSKDPHKLVCKEVSADPVKEVKAAKRERDKVATREWKPAKSYKAKTYSGNLYHPKKNSIDTTPDNDDPILNRIFPAY